MDALPGTSDRVAFPLRPRRCRACRAAALEEDVLHRSAIAR